MKINTNNGYDVQKLGELPCGTVFRFANHEWFYIATDDYTDDGNRTVVELQDGIVKEECCETVVIVRDDLILTNK